MTLDGTGTIVRVPAMPECPLEGRKAVDAWQVFEAADAVFAYFPSVDRPEPQPYELPFELADGEYAHFLCTATWQCNYRYALNNIADPMHGCYLHVDSFTLACGSKQDVMKLDKLDDGFTVARAGQRGDNFDWADAHIFIDDGSLDLRVWCAQRPSTRPLDGMIKYALAVTIEAGQALPVYTQVDERLRLQVRGGA